MKKQPEIVQSDIDVVNAAILGHPGELVLMMWYDADEAVGHYYNLPGFNPKQEFEGQHIAVGILTGELITEDLEGPHWKWVLPTGPKFEMLIWPQLWYWREVALKPQNLGGTYPSLVIAENTGDDPLRFTGRHWRKAQIVVGECAVWLWLRENKHTKGKAEELFADMLQLLKLPVSHSV